MACKKSLNHFSKLDTVQPVNVLWIAAIFLACSVLIRLMNRRQGALREVLEEYVKEQIAFVRRKARATRIASLAAEYKAEEQEKFEKAKAANLAAAEAAIKRAEDEAASKAAEAAALLAEAEQ